MMKNLGSRLEIKNEALGVPVVAQQKRIRLGTMKLRVRSMASLSGFRIWRCHELWCRSTAVAPIAIAWEPPYATGVALKRKRKKKKKRLSLVG